MIRTLGGSVCLALAIGLGFINALSLAGPGEAAPLLFAAAAFALPAVLLLGRRARWFAAALMLFFLFGAWTDYRDGAARPPAPPSREAPAP